MLRSLKIDNLQSFDHIELDLTGKSKSVKNHAFIYGENGSGKSNLINSMFLLLVSTGNIFPKDPKKPEDETLPSLVKDLRMIDADGNTKLDFMFRIDGSDARYVIEFDANGILVNECLYMQITTRTGTIFKLEKDHDPYFTPKLFTKRIFKERIRNLISQYWGKRSFIKIINDETKESNEEFIQNNINSKLLLFISELRNTIVLTKSFNMIYEQFTLPEGEIGNDYEKELNVLETLLSKFFTRLYSDVRGLYFKKDRISNDKIRYKLYFKKNIANKVRDIPATIESTGTLKMINVLGTLLWALDKKMVFVDELDSGIHDLLITNVMKQTIPDINGQMIVTTHNTSIMESLAPENVYIIGVDVNGYKKIRCVSSIERVRAGNNMRDKYFDGNFLGIPYVGELGLKDLLESK